MVIIAIIHSNNDCNNNNDDNKNATLSQNICEIIVVWVTTRLSTITL